VGDSVEPAADPRSPWWDGIKRLRTPHQYWLSIELRQHADFSSVFRSWLNNCNHLQTWLDRFEEDTGGKGTQKQVGTFQEHLRVWVNFTAL